MIARLEMGALYTTKRVFSFIMGHKIYFHALQVFRYKKPSLAKENLFLVFCMK